MESNTNVTGYVGSSISILSGIIGLEYGLNITLLVIGVIGGILSITYTFYKWYKDAKKDGKITKDEIIDLGDKVSPQVNKIVNDIKEVQGNGNDKTITK